MVCGDISQVSAELRSSAFVLCLIYDSVMIDVESWHDNYQYENIRSISCPIAVERGNFHIVRVFT